MEQPGACWGLVLVGQLTNALGAGRWVCRVIERAPNNQIISPCLNGLFRVTALGANARAVNSHPRSRQFANSPNYLGLGCTHDQPMRFPFGCQLSEYLEDSPRRLPMSRALH